MSQIQVWAAAAESARAASGPETPFQARRSSLFESDYSKGAQRRAPRHSLVRLAGDDVEPVSSDDESLDEDVPRRPKVVRVTNVASIDNDDPFPALAVTRSMPRTGVVKRSVPAFVRSCEDRPPPPPPAPVPATAPVPASTPASAPAPQVITVPVEKVVDKEAAAERRALFAARARSAVRPDTNPPAAASEPRARSFFDQRRDARGPAGALAKARASIRLLGRYSRTRSARFPLFRTRSDR